MDDNTYETLINEQYNSFLNNVKNQIESEEAEREGKKLYDEWVDEHRLKDMELAMFMSDKLDTITEIMRRSNKLRSRDGHVSRIEKRSVLESSEENRKLRNEIDGLKDEIKDLKEFLINKLS